MKTVIILATIVIHCAPPEPEADDYIPVECESVDDCECDEVCGDTRTCSLLCSDDSECEPGTVCGATQGYCVVPCIRDTECPEGQACTQEGVCWFPP